MIENKERRQKFMCTILSFIVSSKNDQVDSTATVLKSAFAPLVPAMPKHTLHRA